MQVSFMCCQESVTPRHDNKSQLTFKAPLRSKASFSVPDRTPLWVLPPEVLYFLPLLEQDHSKEKSRSNSAQQLQMECSFSCFWLQWPSVWHASLLCSLLYTALQIRSSYPVYPLLLLATNNSWNLALNHTAALPSILMNCTQCCSQPILLNLNYFLLYLYHFYLLMLVSTFEFLGCKPENKMDRWSDDHPVRKLPRKLLIINTMIVVKAQFLTKLWCQQTILHFSIVAGMELSLKIMETKQNSKLGGICLS